MSYLFDLYLTGQDDAVADNWEDNHLPERIGSIKLYRATPRIGESTRCPQRRHAPPRVASTRR